MAKKFPVDEFDAAPAHGGRHRIRRTAKHRALEFFKIAAYAAIVATLGWGGLKAFDAITVVFDGNLPATTAQTAANKVTPQVTVLDGTKTDGLASKVAHQLLDASYNVVTAANFVDANNAEVKATAIYVGDEAAKAEATKVAKTLKLAASVISINESMAAAGTVTIILGTDFVK